MIAFFDSWIFNFLSFLITLLVLIYAFFQWRYTYWKRKNLYYVEPVFPFGSTPKLVMQKISLGEALKEHHLHLKSLGHKHVGAYNVATPVYLAIDPGYIKNIMQASFEHFVDRGMYYNKIHDPLSANMFTVDGADWRKIRTKLTPTFTSGKMKMMFDTLVAVSYPMVTMVRNLAKHNHEIDAREIAGCFTADVIGSCAFGIDCNSFKDPNSEFKTLGKMALITDFTFYLYTSAPHLARKLGGKFFKPEVSDFFLKIVKETVKYRETNNVRRNDMFQILLDLKNDQGGNNLTVEELAAQTLLFFIAGFETSSTTITMALFEISRHEDIQDKLRDEMEKVLEKHDGKFNYTALTELKFLNQVVEETLRMYPPLPTLHRRCVKDYHVPDTDVVIEKGTFVSVSVAGLHYDPENHPDPERFDPDRFSDERKHKIKPFTYLPFGDGPRACIGLRFGMMQTKVALTMLLRNFKFSLSSKTTLPLEVNASSITYVTNNTIWLDAEKI